jgi:hypothetical protein
MVWNIILFDNYKVTSELQYRIRQFNGYQNEILRNSGTALNIGILQKHSYISTFVNTKLQLQSDIQMNMNEFSSRIENLNIYSGGLEFGMKTNTQHLFKRTTKFKFATIASIHLNMAKYGDSLKNLSQLNFSFQSEIRLK